MRGPAAFPCQSDPGHELVNAKVACYPGLFMNVSGIAACASIRRQERRLLGTNGIAPCRGSPLPFGPSRSPSFGLRIEGASRDLRIIRAAGRQLSRGLVPGCQFTATTRFSAHSRLDPSLDGQADRAALAGWCRSIPRWDRARFLLLPRVWKGWVRETGAAPSDEGSPCVLDGRPNASNDSRLGAARSLDVSGAG